MKQRNMQRFQKNSLFKRIFIPMCVLIGFITVMLIGVGVYSDILGKMDSNSRSLFDQQVKNRTHDLETSMITKWSNLEGDMNRIQKITEELVESDRISIDNLSHSSSDSLTLLENVSDELITILRNHGTTGAYMFLCNGKFDSEEGEYYPGLYFTDNDPESVYSATNTDLLLARSPTELVNKLNISTDSCWQPSFEFHPEDYEFYQKTFENFQLVVKNSDFSLKDVGCWTKPYKLNGSDTYCISYMLPLIYDQKIYGVIGIDISFDYLQKLLDYDELMSSGNSGYVLALKDSENSYQSMFLNGPYFSRTFNHFGKIQVNENYIDNKIYCSVSSLNLYNTNTPNANDHWVLLGLVDKTELYSMTYQLTEILTFIFAFIIILGTLLSFILTRYITKPIIDLSKRISHKTNAISRLNLEKTNIIEIDQLIDAIEKMSNDVLASASRFTNIIRLANTQLAGFEIDYSTNQLFITDDFFEIFMLDDIDTRQMSIEEFKKIFEIFNDCCQPTQNHNEYIYHIETSNEHIYLRLRYHSDKDKCVGLIEEISDVIKERKAIEHERDHDVLTGLMNRRAFQRKMKKLFSIQQEQLKTAALVMMDLDNLKSINDKYGHDCGDAYIRGIAQIFKLHSPEQTIVSRTSGDEFYLFYYGYGDKEEINRHLNTLKEAIGESFIELPNQQKVKVRVSGGVAWYPEDSRDFEELQRYSDYAMYSVKHTVKGEIGVFNILDYENNSYIMKKRIDFHQFMDEHMMIYYFQPIISVNSGKIYGYEALLRSSHPSLKDPQEIIMLAKLEAQLNRIELMTWQEALKTYYEYYQQGQVHKNHKLFINSLSHQIISQQCIDDLEREYHDILQNIVLEVTEYEDVNEEYFEAKKDILKRWNAEIALDDYGSGYNSERNLLMANPVYVKIDMDIIRDIDKDIDKQKIVENIVSYCHERGKSVIAEGIETVSELHVVMGLKVDFVQGYLFAKAMPLPAEIDCVGIQSILDYHKSHCEDK
ncbi:EAL domain-containing protein [Candidatus Stoquefichus massiliensis]|uniref:EAL domain-containing protein n=1 Tax=Candidatus Stoquefichus massiliensis TaxID=1470350 RepID=UPI000480D201|nr:EAL domain-containing protein [Candidatus Stoquefichus massiliensis]